MRVEGATRPYVRKNPGALEPQEQTIGQDVERVMKSTGPAEDALEPAYIQVVDRPMDTEKAQMLKFMEEPVTIHVHSTSDPTAEQVFVIICGGQRELFRRNETKTVKRKFVNILASAKITTYTQERRRDNEGIMHDVQIPHTALRYSFSVIEDKHPRGSDWLRATLAQA